jgi:DNA topoisomerase-1
VTAISRTALSVSELTRKSLNKQPVPPFITFLQQAAAEVFSVIRPRIVTIAQQLYEEVDIPGKGSLGLITCERIPSGSVEP